MTTYNTMKEFFRAIELAEKLDVNVMTIYRYIEDGKLKAYKFGKEFRIDREEFTRFLKQAEHRTKKHE